MNFLFIPHKVQVLVNNLIFFKKGEHLEIDFTESKCLT